MTFRSDTLQDLIPAPFESVELLATDDPLRVAAFTAYDSALTLIDAHNRPASQRQGHQNGSTPEEQLYGEVDTPAAFAGMWVDYTEAEALRRYTGERPLLNRTEQQTIRTAARLCLGPVVQDAFDLVSDYDPQYQERIDGSPLVWRLVMDGLPYGAASYPNAGIISDLSRVPLTPRFFLLGSVAERLSASPRARRVQERALEAVTNYTRRKHDTDPPSAIITTVVGEIALAQSYDNLVSEDPATTTTLLRMRRLNGAIESARRAGASFPLIAKYISEETIQWVAIVRARHHRLLVGTARRDRKPL